jgi:hypothetical protein
MIITRKWVKAQVVLLLILQQEVAFMTLRVTSIIREDHRWDSELTKDYPVLVLEIEWDLMLQKIKFKKKIIENSLLLIKSN